MGYEEPEQKRQIKIERQNARKREAEGRTTKNPKQKKLLCF